MKKKLLLILPVFLFALVSNAQDNQDKTWDFSDASWSGYLGYNSSAPATTTIDGLTLISGGSSVGVVAPAAVTFSDGFKSSSTMTVGSATGAPAPTKRALSIAVTGPCTVTVWTSTSSTGRIAYISDGTNVLKSYTSASPSPYNNVLVANYTGTGGTIYVYTNNTMTFAKISRVYTPLSTHDFRADGSVKVYSNGDQVFVSNIKSATTVAIYSLSGALVKTVETSSDTSFNLKSGVWIAKVKSAEGEKTVKLVVK